MKAINCYVIAALLACVSSVETWAADSILWRGWADIGSCNRIKYYTDDFGNPWPTNESVGQTLTGEIYLAQSVDEVAVNHLKSCALKGVVAAGATTILTSGAAAWPTFKVTFNSCLTSEGLTNFLGDNISIRYDTHCNW